jgi:hypothetical protein
MADAISSGHNMQRPAWRATELHATVPVLPKNDQATATLESPPQHDHDGASYSPKPTA